MADESPLEESPMKVTMDSSINELLLAGILSENSPLAVKQPAFLLKPKKFYLGVL